jgi:hypothetical protein
MKSPFRFATLAASVLLSACSSAASHSLSTNDAIARYVAGEDNDFADLRGAFKVSNETSRYYASRQTLPGSSACVVYDYAIAKNHLGGCRFEAGDLHAATVLYHEWLVKIQSALPHWQSMDVRNLPKGDVAATIFTDPQRVHGVYVDIFGDAYSGYRVTTTFAKMAVLQS